MAQGGGSLPNSIQHCDVHSVKVNADRSMWDTGISAWVGMGVRRAQHSFLCTG